MASKSETGHGKNVVSLEKLNAGINLMGPEYNPFNPLIKIPAMVSKYGTAKGLLETVTETKSTWDKAVRDRDLAFQPFRTFSTEILHALVASDVSPQTIEKIKSILTKIRGKRAKALEKPELPKEGEEPVPQKRNSVSQQSFDSQVEHFEALIGMLSTEPNYNPNEANLSLNGLNDLLTDLHEKNTAVINLTAQLKQARANRDECLYAEKAGVVDLSKTTKAYVISVFKKNSKEHNSIKGLKFFDRKKK